MKPISDEQFLEYSYLANLKVSPNERYFSYSKANARLKKNDYIQIVIIDYENDKISYFNFINSFKQ